MVMVKKTIQNLITKFLTDIIPVKYLVLTIFFKYLPQIAQKMHRKKT